jgi:NAD(P)-dependent dehydrogenase (short-subunit alcohol dehydrogenase family)
MDLELIGKTAIVTGGGRGMGKAFARQLALEGVDVVIAARNMERLNAAAKEIAEETGRRIVPIQVDTGDDASVRNMVKQAIETLGHIDILVNNAALTVGGARPPVLDNLTAEDFWADVNVKVVGYLRCARELAPHMRERRWGRIINIAGLAARESGATVRSIRNASVVALTKNLADELGPYGINVTVVHPGVTYGETVETVLSDPELRQVLVLHQEGFRRREDEMLALENDVRGITREEAERRVTQGISIRRLVHEREVAFVVAFLASPRSVAINGDLIAAGGGDGRAIYY